MASLPEVELELGTLRRMEPLTDRVADLIRKAILDGHFPPGAKLSVPELARRLGVSRTPAREALLILERDGLVSTRAGTGMEVLIGDHAGLAEVLEIREAMEGLAARLAAERLEDSDLERMAKLVEQHHDALEDHDLDKHVELDAEFHRILRKGSGNSRLATMLERIEQQMILLNRSLSDTTGFEPRATEKDHRAIVEALKARDGERAEAAMRKHVRRMRNFFLSNYRERG
jgi:DNA-binding GntR family transcriptional regulator